MIYTYKDNLLLPLHQNDDLPATEDFFFFFIYLYILAQKLRRKFFLSKSVSGYFKTKKGSYGHQAERVGRGVKALVAGTLKKRTLFLRLPKCFLILPFLTLILPGNLTFSPLLDALLRVADSTATFPANAHTSALDCYNYLQLKGVREKKCPVPFFALGSHIHQLGGYNSSR